MYQGNNEKERILSITTEGVEDGYVLKWSQSKLRWVADKDRDHKVHEQKQYR